jgi:Mo25-like
MSSLLKNLGVKKKKSPEQLVRAAAQALDDNNTESIAKRLAAMKEILYGEEDKDPVETKCKELSASLRQAVLMPRLIEAMPSLPFETRKDLAQVFNNLVRKNHEGFAEYVAGTPSIVPMLVSSIHLTHKHHFEGSQNAPDDGSLCDLKGSQSLD